MRRVEETASALFLKGFVDARFGPRLVNPTENDFYSLGEIRSQFDLKYAAKPFNWSFVADLKYTPLQTDAVADVAAGVGLLDLREWSLATSLGSSFELKAGRQILTWGTGDLLFINDLFPKDWQALLTGRPVNYLKAPSNSIKLSNYNRWLTVDLVYTPLFTPDRFVNGSIVEYYDPLSGSISGASAIIQPLPREKWFRNGEWAIRLHKNVKGIEYDIYGYRGYWKTPEGFTAQGQYFFPELSVLGASVRVPLFAGIFSVEYGHYFSAGQEAEAGTPIRGPEDRWLVGFEKEVAKDFTLRGQFYLEYINNYEEYLANFGSFAFREEWRALLSLRVEYLTWEPKTAAFPDQLLLSGGPGRLPEEQHFLQTQ